MPEETTALSISDTQACSHVLHYPIISKYSFGRIMVAKAQILEMVD